MCYQKQPFNVAMASACRKNQLFVIFWGVERAQVVQESLTKRPHFFVFWDELSTKSLNMSFREEFLWLEARLEDAFRQTNVPHFCTHQANTLQVDV